MTELIPLKPEAQKAHDALIQSCEVNLDWYNRLARYSGMPLNTGLTHILMKFLPGPGTQQAYQAAIDFVTDKREHHFITFVGEPGRGKTHLALGIGWQWLGQDKGPVKFWHVSELLDAMRNEYNNPPKDSWGLPLRSVFDHAKETSLLILDDLGVEKSTEWVIDKLDSLIDHRYLNELPTVITTNMAPSQLQPRLRSRIREGIVVTLEGPDYREIKAKLRRDS